MWNSSWTCARAAAPIQQKGWVSHHGRRRHCLIAWMIPRHRCAAACPLLRVGEGYRRSQCWIQRSHPLCVFSWKKPVHRILLAVRLRHLRKHFTQKRGTLSSEDYCLKASCWIHHSHSTNPGGSQFVYFSVPDCGRCLGISVIKNKRLINHCADEGWSKSAKNIHFSMKAIVRSTEKSTKQNRTDLYN